MVTEMVKKFTSFMDPVFYYRVHKSHPSEPILNQVNQVHTLTPYSRSILILASNLRPVRVMWVRLNTA